MKKVYFVDCDSEFQTKNGLENFINEKCDGGFYTYKEAKRHLIDRAKYMKEILKTELQEEKKKGNIIYLDLYQFSVRDDFDFDNYDDISTLYENDYYIKDSRYLCGRYC